MSPIRELAIHLVSSTVVRAWGSLPTSFTVRMRCWDDLSSLTASSCRMLRKLRPFTSRIWSPTCQDHNTTQHSHLGCLQTPTRARGFRALIPFLLLASLPTRSLRLREVVQMPEGYSARQWQRHPSHSDPEPMLLSLERDTFS